MPIFKQKEGGVDYLSISVIIVIITLIEKEPPMGFLPWIQTLTASLFYLTTP